MKKKLVFKRLEFYRKLMVYYENNLNEFIVWL